MKLVELLTEAAPKDPNKAMRKWMLSNLSFHDDAYNFMKDKDAVILDAAGKVKLGPKVRYADFSSEVVDKPPMPLAPLFSRRPQIHMDYFGITVTTDLLVNVHDVDFSNCKLPSFAAMAPYLTKTVKLAVNMRSETESVGGVLSLLKYPKLNEFFLTYGSLRNAETPKYKELAKVAQLVCNHLKGDRDKLALQNELIDADLDEYATL